MNSTPQEPVCELCGRPLNKWTAGDLKGICGYCCDHLGGGKYSAGVVKAESRAIAQRFTERRVR